MKICQIAYSFPPSIGGGTYTHNYSLARYLVEEAHDVDVIVLRSKKDIENLPSTIDGIKVHNIPSEPFPSWVFQIRDMIKKVEKEKKIDVFDLHSINHILPFALQKRKILTSLHFYEVNCPGARVARGPSHLRYSRPCIYSFKKCWRCCGGIKNYLNWRLVRDLSVTKTAKFMVKSEYLKKFLIKVGIEEKRVVVVPHWIDVESINKKSKSVNSSINKMKNSDYIFMFFGRLAEEKGPDILLKAFAHLIKEVQDIKLVFIGDGPLRKNLEKSCGNYNLKDKVIFLGMIPHKDLFGYLSIADTILFPSNFDNYNWALLEAMCSEKPIIATNLGATTDILIDRYNALLAEPTKESISKKMKEILEKPILANKMAQNALKTVRNKHSLKNLEKYEVLVKEIHEEEYASAAHH